MLRGETTGIIPSESADDSKALLEGRDFIHRQVGNRNRSRKLAAFMSQYLTAVGAADSGPASIYTTFRAN